MTNFKIEQKNSAYTSKVGQLVSFLQYARSCTIAVVENCSNYQLDYLLDERSNTIGTLLKHIAAMEFQLQCIIFEERKLNTEELQIWKGCFAGELSTNDCKLFFYFCRS